MSVRTRSRSFRAAAPRDGLTLIELLLSLAIGVMVVTLVFTTHRTVTSVLRGQRERERGPRAIALAREQLQRDLATLFVPGHDRDCALLVERDPDREQASILSFCGLEPREGERDLRWSDVVRYRYQLGVAPAGGLQFERVRHRPTGPLSASAPVTNVLAEGVDRFVVQLFDGVAWQDLWPPAGSTNAAAPHLARVALGDQTTDLFLPVGLVVTSTIQRAAETAP